MRLIIAIAAFGFVAGQASAASFIPDPIIERTPFDKPVRFVRHILPAAENAPNPAGVVRCYYYPTFTVKELDNGEHGDDAISVTPFSSAAARPACGKQNDPGEVILKDGQGGYFVGAKSDFVYLLSTNGADTNPFSLVNAQTGKTIYTDQGLDPGPAALSVIGDVLTLSYTHGAAGSCSILAGGETCWSSFAHQTKLPRIIAVKPAPVEACRTGYGTTPATHPSVVAYPVTITVDLKGEAKVLSRGNLICRPQS
jgi:hypothetical protein